MGRASAGSTRRSAPGRCSPTGKEERLIDGVPHVLEPPIRADVALVYAARADELGNLWYRRTARNFNPLMATAARITVAEAGEIVPLGELDAEAVVTPHLYVDFLVRGDMSGDPKLVIAARAAQELQPGEVVNLGIGIPNLIPGFLGPDDGRLPAYRERAARRRPATRRDCARPRSDRRRQAPGDRAPRCVVLRQRTELRDDPRRSRRCCRPGCAPGERRRRHRQLGRPRARTSWVSAARWTWSSARAAWS